MDIDGLLFKLISSLLLLVNFEFGVGVGFVQTRIQRVTDFEGLSRELLAGALMTRWVLRQSLPLLLQVSRQNSSPRASSTLGTVVSKKLTYSSIVLRLR